MKYSLRSLMIVMALGLLVLVAICVKPLRIVYHRHQMSQSLQESLKADRAGEDPTPSFDRFEYHLKRLVALGSVAKREYRLANVYSRTNQSKELWESISAGKCPPQLHVTSEFPKTPEPMVLVIWCELKDAPAWDQFIESVDHPAEEKP